ncbi:hypothetical protein FHX16_006050 [Rhizobium sp. BK661]|nr:hypothetical protein [Rhizobium sp. BK661]
MAELANNARRFLCQPLDNQVARRMATGIVHMLEVVDITHDK